MAWQQLSAHNMCQKVLDLKRVIHNKQKHCTAITRFWLTTYAIAYRWQMTNDTSSYGKIKIHCGPKNIPLLHYFGETRSIHTTSFHLSLNITKKTFKMASFFTLTGLKSLAPFINSTDYSALWQALPSVSQALLPVGHILNWCLHTILHHVLYSIMIIIIIIITDLYSAFRSEDTEVLDAAQKD